MLERIISSVLNTFLGNFIENLDSEQLKISLWSSTVKLENLQIKPTLFDSMPVPFTLHYGKVGRIFIDIPIMNLSSSPLKLEISDVFVFIKPKNFDLWSEKVEIDAYIEKTISFLDKFETYLTESTQLEQQSPGMLANLVSNIVYNIQIKIKNVYVRIEDSLSIPRMPFTIGIVVGEVTAQTMNDKWQPQFTLNQEITNKEFSIKDFAVYLNFERENNKALLFDEITKDWKEKDNDKKYMRFLKQECTFENSKQNNYIIERFQIQARGAINKNVRNKKPQIWANLVLGGEFQGPEHKIISEFGKYFYFSMQQQQIFAMMKFLEYVGNYGKFQTGVITNFHKIEMTPEIEQEYIDIYLKYKECIDKKEIKKAEAFRNELKEKYEKQYSQEKLILVRTIATKKYEFEQMRLKEESKVKEKIKEIDKNKESGIMSSLVGIFGFGKKTPEEIENEKRMNEEKKKKLEQEALKNIQQQNLQLVNQIQMLKKTGKIEDTQLDAEFKELLGTDWVQFDIQITIPEVHILFSREDKNKLVELLIDKMSSTTHVGLDYLDTSFTLHTFNIKDHTNEIFNTGSKEEVPYPYLIQTYIPFKEKFINTLASQSGLGSFYSKQKNALNVNFIKNPRIAKGKNGAGCAMKLTLTSDSQLFLFANFQCINAVKDMFISAFSESTDSKELLKYYKGLASEQLFKYVNEGSQFMLTAQENEQKKKTHNAIMLDVKLNAPVLFIPERYDQTIDNQVLVVDLGNIKIDSSLIEFDPDRNYKMTNNPILLYDAYNFLLKDVQLIIFSELADYRKYSMLNEGLSVKLIKDVSLKLSFYNNIEPAHPIRPTYEIQVSLESMGITASDHVFAQIMRLKDKVLANIQGGDTEVKQSIAGGEQIKIEEVKQEVEEKKDEMEFEDENQIQLDANLMRGQKMSSENKVKGISMNVVVTIGCLELEVQERVQSEDNDFDILINNSIQYRDLIKIRMSDLVVNYMNDGSDKQTITLILTHFDIVDRSMVKNLQGKMVPYIPEIYAHIVSNPEFLIKRQVAGITPEPKFEELNLHSEDNILEEYKSDDHFETRSARHRNQQRKSISMSAKSGGIADKYRKFNNQTQYSGASGDFQSCLSGESSITSINYNEIERVAQIFTRIIIQEKGQNNQKIDIDFVFSEFRLIVSLPTFEKLFKFSQKFQPKENQTTADDDLFSKQLGLYNQRQSMAARRSDSGEFRRRASQIIKDNIVGGASIKIENRRSRLKSISLIQEEPEPKKTIKKEQKIRFNGRFKNVALWIPLDSRIKNSRVFSFSLMSLVNFRRDQISIDTLKSDSTEIESTSIESCTDDAIVTINQLQMVMINRHQLEMTGLNAEEESKSQNSDHLGDDNLDQESAKVTTEKLLEPSRITVTYQNSVQQDGLKTLMDLDVTLEPFEVKVGFRELDFFMQLNKNVQDFLVVINTNPNEEPQLADLTRQTEHDIDKKIKQMQIQEKREIQSEQKNGNQIAEKDRKKIRREEQVQRMNLKFRCDTFRFSLMDDTGMQEYPVIFMNIRSIKFDSRKYEDIDEAADFILKKIGILKQKNDEEQPFNNTKASLILEIYYFNLNVQQYEPFLEPWVLEFSQFQEEKYTGELISVSSPQLLNLNITFALMDCLMTIQKRFSQDSKEWLQEDNQKQTTSAQRATQQQQQNFGIQQDLGSTTQRDSEQNQSDNSSGFTFVNRLGIPCSITVEGWNQKEDESTLEELEKDMKAMKERDPKRHELQQRITCLKRERDMEGQSVTQLTKDGSGIKKFRKSDELYYMMKQIKRSKELSNKAVKRDDEILKVDLQIENQQPIKSIPIELGGVRSYLMIPESDFMVFEESKEQLTHKVEIEEIEKSPVAMLCKVKFDSQTRREVEFQSSLIISNCSQFDITIYAKKEIEHVQNKKKGKKEKKEELLIEIPHKDYIEVSELKNASKLVVVESGKIFHVPLSWFLKSKSIYVQKRDGNLYPLFYNIREYFAPSSLKNADKLFGDIEPQNIEVYDQNSQSQTYVSVNISLFKCKPTNLNVPGQYLVTFTPPVCVFNYLFSDLFLLKNDQDIIGVTESKGLFYLNDIKFEEYEHGLGCPVPIKWKFQEENNSYFISEKDEPLFMPKKKQKKDQLQGSSQMIKLKNSKKAKLSLRSSNRNLKFEPQPISLIEESKSDEDDLGEIDDECVLNLEMQPFNILINEYDNFELRDKVFEKTASVMLQLYPQFMIVNQTEQDLAIKTLAEGVSKDKDRVIIVRAHTNEFFYSSSYKAQIKVKGYQWSKVFDGSTQGLSGSVEVKSLTEDYESQEKYLNFGVVFENGTGSFTRTKIIKIVPRYIIYNALEEDIVIKQKNQTLHTVIKADEKVRVYNFQNKEKDPFIQISDHVLRQIDQNKGSQIEQQTEDFWSSAFSIDDVGDFQVEFNSNVQHLSSRHTTTSRISTAYPTTHRAWHLPNENNFNKRIVRVTVTTQDDATIFIKICKPKFPEYYIFNDTSVPIEFRQLKCDQMDPRIIIPDKKIPFVWYDQTQPDKKLILKIDGKEKSFVIDKIFTKELQTAKDSKEKGSSILARMMLQSMMKKESKFSFDMKGIGISLIDNEPREILYLSIYKLNFMIEKVKFIGILNMLQWTEQQSKRDQMDGIDQINELITKYDLKIDHIQIDNMLNNVMPVFFCPTKELIKDEDIALKNVKEEDLTPFIQVMITYSEIQDKDIYIKKYRGLQVAIQEMKIQVETGFVNSLLKFIGQLQTIQSQDTQFTSGLTQKHASKRQQRESKSHLSTMKLAVSREQICPSLNASLPELLPEVEQANDKKIFFEVINLGAIKIKITTRFEKKALALGSIKSGLGVGGLLQIVFTSVATISDSPLTFKEIVIVNTYSTQTTLIDMLTRNYTRQGILQFYKLLGSSDLLGNPVGLIDKLGTGVFEFFNEPRKGLLKGPKEFVGGMGKGVKSLVTNVVSGSFDSVSKITGSLYGVLKNVSGNQVNEEQMALKKPESAFDGVYQGLKGGASELVQGVTGIFTKPYKRAKQEGAVGFFKGVGAGFIGAVASPFTATLRLGNNVSTGIKNSAIRIGKGKLPTYGRFRHPRYFNTKNILQPFDESIAEANEILKTIKEGHFANSTQYINLFKHYSILFFADFSTRRGKSQHAGILIITDTQLLYVEDFKNLKFSCPLKSITKCEVFEEKLSNKEQISSIQEEPEDSDYLGESNAVNKLMKKQEDEEGKLQYKYHIFIQAKKNLVQVGGKVGVFQQTSTLKLEGENYPIIDKVYSILGV